MSLMISLNFIATLVAMDLALMYKSDLKFDPVFYFSKRTTVVENMYSFELETLAIIYALNRFRICWE